MKISDNKGKDKMPNKKTGKNKKKKGVEEI